MTGALNAAMGDPGRIHAEGLTARVAVEQAREQVAGLFGARSREVVFTSGATEAIATAVWGAAERGAHQVVPAVEHSAVRESAARAGEVSVIGVDHLGRVDPDDVLAAVRPDTALVHIQWANHEVGTLQPVAEVVAGCRERGVLVHVDAGQANGHLEIDFGGLGADLLSLSAHKLGGPPGAGALLVRRGPRLRPLLLGGDQERARRAGMEDVPALVGFGAACAALATDGRLAAEAEEARRLTDRVLTALATDPGLARIRPYGGVGTSLVAGASNARVVGGLLGADLGAGKTAWDLHLEGGMATTFGGDGERGGGAFVLGGVVWPLRTEPAPAAPGARAAIR